MAIAGDARPFDLVERPLRAWLDWHGSDDDSREEEIGLARSEQEQKMKAAERQAENYQLMRQEAQRMHIRTIEQMFQNTEAALQKLLSTVGRSSVALRSRFIDVEDSGQWLRWEASPQ
jgi:flagellar motor switch protein FliM